jgi:hypothetical protein
MARGFTVPSVRATAGHRGPVRGFILTYRSTDPHPVPAAPRRGAQPAGEGLHRARLTEALVGYGWNDSAPNVPGQSLKGSPAKIDRSPANPVRSAANGGSTSVLGRWIPMRSQSPLCQGA